nr:hypothetical protein [Tanacetum cinerariifolium]
AKVAVLVKSPGGKVYMLGEDLFDWYLNNVVETGQLGCPTNESDQCYADVSQEEESLDGMDIGQLEEEMKNDAVRKADESAKLGSEEMKKNVVVEDNDAIIINNSQAVLDSDEMKKNVVNEANDLMINNSQAVLDSDEMKKNVVNEANDLMINNSQPMFDSYLSLDMSWSDSDMFDMSWLDSDTIDMSWINTCSEHGDTHTNDTFNLNFHHGVEVLNRNIPAKMGSEEMKKNVVVEDDNDSMMIDNSQAVLDSDEIKKTWLMNLMI